MKTEIYVMTHKECAIPNIPGYVRLQVGSALHEDLGYLRDDAGEDHISDLNPYYAELTGLYRLWKQPTDADNIGICHYRRFFINDNKQIMTMPEYEELLADADIIVAVAENECPYLELFAKAHKKEDLLAAGKAIKELYPEDYPAFEEMLKSKRITYGNLCVMPRDLYFAYCEWLFTVLLTAGDYIDISEYDEYHRKIFGILAESLLWVYMRSRQLKVKECRAGFFGVKAETEELIRTLRVLLDNGEKEKARILYHDTLKRRPDLTSPESDLDGTLAALGRKVMNTEERKLTMIIPIIKRDFDRMTWDFSVFFDCLPITRIVFIGPAELETAVKETAANTAGNYDIEFLNENQLINYKRVQEFLNGLLTKWGYGMTENSRPGWYYQQFLKMEYSRICEEDYYLSWDADTIPLHRIELFDAEGIPYLDVKGEYGVDYFITIRRMLGMEKSYEKSFISEHMLFSKIRMQELIAELDATAFEGERYYEKIFAAMGEDNIKSGFSEFETYGTWLMNRHPKDYHIRDWKSLRKGSVLFQIDKLTKEDRAWLGESYDAITFEKYHPYMKEWAELFQNPQFRQTMRADEIYEMIMKSGEFGQYENGMIREGENLWPI